MAIGRKEWAAMLSAAADLLEGQSGRLSEIDSRFGDGDHGVTMGKIAAQIKNSISGWQDGDTLATFTEGLGDAVMGVNGGSAGPLYGTLIGGLAEPLGDTAEIDAPMLKKMLAACREAMYEITKARVGDKTMMDALIPAVDAAQATPDDIPAVLDAAAKAAEEGAKASEGFVSKFGRARSYKEQTIGTPDAGAVSTSLLLRGLADGFQQ